MLKYLSFAMYRNYILSIILGTVAFSYGSVPMYKMVRIHVTTPQLTRPTAAKRIPRSRHSNIRDVVPEN